MLVSCSTYGFHLVNTLLHAFVVLLVAHLAMDELQFNTEQALLIGLLFATHPIHVEAVSTFKIAIHYYL